VPADAPRSFGQDDAVHVFVVDVVAEGALHLYLGDPGAMAEVDGAATAVGRDVDVGVMRL